MQATATGKAAQVCFRWKPVQALCDRLSDVSVGHADLCAPRASGAAHEITHNFQTGLLKSFVEIIRASGASGDYATGTYGPTATGGGSGKPAVFSIDPASTPPARSAAGL